MAAAAVREGSEMAATSGAFVDGETAGARFVRQKTAMGARTNGAWATPRRSPGSRSVALMVGRTCRPEAANVLRQNDGPAGVDFRRDNGLKELVGRYCGSS